MEGITDEDINAFLLLVKATDTDYAKSFYNQMKEKYALPKGPAIEPCKMEFLDMSITSMLPNPYTMMRTNYMARYPKEGLNEEEFKQVTKSFN